MFIKLKLLLPACFLSFLSSPTWALPPAADVPEEILRTEIILEGRSPVDGKPLSASKYEQLEAELAQRAIKPQINGDLQELVFLLQLRKLFKTIIPFY